jgi:hypothetical protein
MTAGNRRGVVMLSRAAQAHDVDLERCRPRQQAPLDDERGAVAGLRQVFRQIRVAGVDGKNAAGGGCRAQSFCRQLTAPTCPRLRPQCPRPDRRGAPGQTAKLRVGTGSLRGWVGARLGVRYRSREAGSLASARPGLRSSRIHILDTKPDPKRPTIIKVIEPEEVAEKASYTRPHTVHCGPEGIYVAALSGRAPPAGQPRFDLLRHTMVFCATVALRSGIVLTTAIAVG